MTGHTSCTDNNRTQRHQKSALLHTFFSLPKKKENPEASKIFVLCCKAKRAPCTVCPVFFLCLFIIIHCRYILVVICVCTETFGDLL